MKLTRRIHVGYHRYGRCWRLRWFRSRYARVTFYGFWRFYISVERARCAARCMT